MTNPYFHTNGDHDGLAPVKTDCLQLKDGLKNVVSADCGQVRKLESQVLETVQLYSGVLELGRVAVVLFLVLL